MHNWRHLSTTLINRFGKYITFKRLISSTFSESTGEPINVYEEIPILCSIQPAKKKGSIGGENEIEYVPSDMGDYENGAFVCYTKYLTAVREQDEVKDLTLNGKNYGDFFVDRIQDWADANGLYKFRILTKSLYGSRTDWVNENVNN